jgi:hypothetical protein
MWVCGKEGGERTRTRNGKRTRTRNGKEEEDEEESAASE